MNHSEENARPRVAIVGSGPSGFYAAEALLRSDPPIAVDMFDALPTPFGLVRSGVAPDHPKIKQVTAIFERLAQHHDFRFFGNVTVGKNIPLSDLRSHYTATILAVGMSCGQELGIVGESMPGSYQANEFIGWYNGHPDFRDSSFDLESTRSVVIIGQGNVACDVARILLTPVDVLRQTDISSHAIEVLARSKINRVTLIGRRSPAQLKITRSELRELGDVPNCAIDISAESLSLNDESIAELASQRGVEQKKVFDLLQSLSRRPPSDMGRTIALRFLESPIAVSGINRVERLTLCRNRLVGSSFHQSVEATNETVVIPCDFLVSSVGYRGSEIFGAPFDRERGTIPNISGRAIHSDGTQILGLYVTGWIKRGPSGVIGTNREDSVETVAALLADLPRLNRSNKRHDEPIEERTKWGIRVSNWQDWVRIDNHEKALGATLGKPREKLTRRKEMLETSRRRTHQ